MLSSHYLHHLLFGTALLVNAAHAAVRKEGSVCTVIPDAKGGDDSPSILSAFSQCNKDASVLFLNETYHVERVMATHGLHNVTVDIQGTLLWGTNTTYWINNSTPLGYQNQSVAWDFGGDNILWTGHGFGTFDGNGQVWYDLANGRSNMPGRPINLVIRNSTNFTMQGMRFVQSQFWTLAVHTAQNVLMEDIFIHSVSNSSASTINTDGIDTFYTNNITIRNWDVTGGDDAVSPKANSSNMLVQDSHFHGTSGIAIGSIGQYLGRFEFIENVLAERIICDGCRHAGYMKTFTGVQKGVPPNGGGGGLGFARNITFRDFTVSGITDSVAQITQCVSFEGQTGDCDTSKFQLSDFTWQNISGTVNNNILGTLQCSGAAPCTGIVISGVEGLKYPNGAQAKVGCSNVQLGPGSVACNGSP